MTNIDEDVSVTKVFVGDDVFGIDERVQKNVAAKILGVSESKINRLVRDGAITYVKYGRTQQSKIVFLVRDLLDYLNTIMIGA
jgi:hypothetical protein